MGIHDSLAGSGKRGPLDNVEVAPGIVLPAALAEYWPRIERTRMPAIRIKATPIDDPSPRKSSFGCYPILPHGFAYPRNAHGTCLNPLAQICWSEVPVLEGYPNRGLLQFYIWLGDYGAMQEDPTNQRNFRVLYFEEEEFARQETDFSCLDEMMAADDSPVSQPHSLTFFRQEDYLGAADVRGQMEYLEIKAELSKKYPKLERKLDEELWSLTSCSGHKIGGYAYFTQTDPRGYDADYRDWLLLLQVDTDDHIMWGDAGVANFFIDREDLANKNFSRVYYTWDCC